MNKNIYLIPVFNIPTLKAKFEKLSKLALKLGLTVPSYKLGQLIPAYTIQGSPDDPGANGFGEIYVDSKYEIEVFGEFPKIPGYTFLGTVEHTSHGNVLRSAPGQAIPEDFRTSEATCDHCETKRYRKDTFVVWHEASNQIKRVGRACVQHFLGGLSPDDIAYMATLVREISELSQDDSEGRNTKKGIETVIYLSYVVMVVENQGYYVSKAKECPQDGKFSTSGQAYNEYERALMKKSDAQHPSKSQIDQAIKMLEWAKEMDVKSSFEANLKVLAQKEVLERRDYSFIASIVPTYNRAQDLIKKHDEKVQKNEENPGEFVGEIGKRQKMELTFKRELTFQNDFGAMFYLFFEDTNGNVLVWKTGTVPWIPLKMKYQDGKEYYMNGSLIKDEKYNCKATVKKFETYKGKRQTIVSRVSFEEIEGQTINQEAI